jgi:RNA polymerase sigma factor (TIGR02999 family)
VISQPPQEVTQPLHAWRRGDGTALDRLIPVVYDELRRLAHCYMARERARNTLQTTALIHEAWLRLVDAHQVDWKNRVHFFAISANVMRRILVEFARARGRHKRSAGARDVTFDDAAVIAPRRGEDLVALDDALQALAAIEPRQAKVVELRFFGGMTEEETAEMLRISTDTVLRDWKKAKLWLWREMKHGGRK